MPYGIKEIDVEDLFGHYSYSIKSGGIDSSLVVLYGENGAGKTTILKIVFLMMSQLRGRGHKSMLANIKFKRVAIILNDGSQITAFREKQLIGNYTYSVQPAGKECTSIQFKTSNRDGHFSITDVSEDFEEVLHSLTVIGLNVHFLSDSRKGWDSVDTFQSHMYEDFSRSKNPKSLDKNDHAEIVKNAINKVEHWILRKTLEATRGEEETISDIYSGIIHRLKNTDPVIDNMDKVNKIIKDFADQRHFFESISSYNLISSPKYDSIIHELQDISVNNGIVGEILMSYVEIQDRKIRTLKPLVKKINAFIDSVNHMFSNKRITYSTRDGFRVTYLDDDEEINFADLSSGESQLLVLMCDVLASGDRSSLFIIDEPELSLNVKWQRSLIETLLTISSDTQFLIATHSMELLSKYLSNVVKLDNNHGSKDID